MPSAAVRPDPIQFPAFLPARTLAHDCDPLGSVVVRENGSSRCVFCARIAVSSSCCDSNPARRFRCIAILARSTRSILKASRQLCTGELIGPGGYVYEPAGNTDWWTVVGDVPLVVLVVVMGAVFGLGGFDQTAQREDPFGHLGVGQPVSIDRLHSSIMCPKHMYPCYPALLQMAPVRGTYLSTDPDVD